MAAPRILLCGDVLGRLNILFKRVQSVNKSAGPFDAILCVGQFFPDSPELLEEFMDYIECRSEIPLPTYFIGDYGIGAPKVLSEVSKNLAHLGFKVDGLKIRENLYWLKGSGIFNLHGLSVAYLSGRTCSGAQIFGTYNEDDVGALRAMADESGMVDLLLTNEWPSGVMNKIPMSDAPGKILDLVHSDVTVSELVAEIKPRYHIAGSKGVFYAREPYSNIDAKHITRFYGLAPVGNKEKQKFLHAISPTPASKMSHAEIITKPPNTTPFPYVFGDEAANSKEATKRSNDSASESQYWRYDVSHKRQKHGAGDAKKLCFKYLSSGSCPRGENCHFNHNTDSREQFLRGVCIDFIIKDKCEKGPDCTYKHSLQTEGDGVSCNRSVPENASANRSRECWFCLSSPNVESHLIISVGESYYCALAKGPLVDDHVLLMPIEHSPNTLSLPSECEDELEKFRNALTSYYKGREKIAVFFEWVSKRGTHANLQVVPVPLSRKASLQEIFNMAAKRLGFEFVATQADTDSDGRKSLKTRFDKNSSLFYVELAGGTILSHLVDENEKFPAQFGREVLAGLLRMPDRADWRNCTLSKEEETKMAEDFKNRFKSFDPFL